MKNLTSTEKCGFVIWCQKNLQLNSCQMFYMRLARKKLLLELNSELQCPLAWKVCRHVTVFKESSIYYASYAVAYWLLRFMASPKYTDWWRKKRKREKRNAGRQDEAMTSKCSFDNVERIKSSRPQGVFPVCFALWGWMSVRNLTTAGAGRVTWSLYLGDVPSCF